MKKFWLRSCFGPTLLNQAVAERLLVQAGCWRASCEKLFCASFFFCLGKAALCKLLLVKVVLAKLLCSFLLQRQGGKEEVLKDKVVDQAVLGKGCCKLLVQNLLCEAGVFQAELLKGVLGKLVLLKLPLICGKIVLKLLF